MITKWIYLSTVFMYVLKDIKLGCLTLKIFMNKKLHPCIFDKEREIEFLVEKNCL